MLLTDADFAGTDAVARDGGASGQGASVIRAARVTRSGAQPDPSAESDARASMVRACLTRHPAALTCRIGLIPFHARYAGGEFV